LALDTIQFALPNDANIRWELLPED